jgi:tetratricopeptide (TPR) repeat protein
VLDPVSTWLREQRLTRGWTIAEMGRKLSQAAKTTGDHTVPRTAILASYVRRWETGKIGLTERYRLHYCAAFELAAAQFGPAPSGREPAAVAELELMAISSGHSASGTARIAPERTACPDWNDVAAEPGSYRESEQRSNVTELVTELAETPRLCHLVALMAEESLDFGEWADTSNIGDATLAHYADQVRQIARDYVHAPPHPMLLDVKRLRDRVFVKLQGHQPPGQTRDLYLIGSQVCGMLAWMSGDLGYQRAAQAQAWTAWVCAEHAAHDGARAWVRAAQSKLAYWDGRFVESAQLADDGLRYAAPGSVPVLLAVQMARALARAGKPDEANRAISRARACRDEVSGDDEIGGAFGLTDAQFHYMSGTTHLWRRDPGQAISESTHAIELFQDRQPNQPHYGPEALTRIDQACAYLQQGSLDGAEAALRPVLDLASELRLELVTQSLGIVRQALTEPALRSAAVAQELQEEIEDYIRESIVHDLRS